MKQTLISILAFFGLINPPTHHPVEMPQIYHESDDKVTDIEFLSSQVESTLRVYNKNDTSDDCTYDNSISKLQFKPANISSTETIVRLTGIFLNECSVSVRVILEIGATGWGPWDTPAMTRTVTLPTEGSWPPGKHNFEVIDLFPYEPELWVYRAAIVGMDRYPLEKQ